MLPITSAHDTKVAFQHEACQPKGRYVQFLQEPQCIKRYGGVKNVDSERHVFLQPVTGLYHGLPEFYRTYNISASQHRHTAKLAQVSQCLILTGKGVEQASC